MMDVETHRRGHLFVLMHSCADLWCQALDDASDTQRPLSITVQGVLTLL